MRSPFAFRSSRPAPLPGLVSVPRTARPRFHRTAPFGPLCVSSALLFTCGSGATRRHAIFHASVLDRPPRERFARFNSPPCFKAATSKPRPNVPDSSCESLPSGFPRELGSSRRPNGQERIVRFSTSALRRCHCARSACAVPFNVAHRFHAPGKRGKEQCPCGSATYWPR